MLKRSAVFFMFFLYSVLPAQAYFTDISKDSLTFFYENGIFTGYPDGSFKPNSFLNRAELMKIIMVATKRPIPVPDQACFTDVSKTAWFAPYVCSAKALGYVHGYPDGSFKPEQYVNKVEALKMILEVVSSKEAKVVPVGFQNTMIDIDQKAWYVPYVNSALYMGFIDLPQNKKFDPGHGIIREDVAEILFRVILEQRTGFDLKKDLGRAARDFFSLESYSKLYSKFPDMVDFEMIEADGKSYGILIYEFLTSPDYSLEGARMLQYYAFINEYDSSDMLLGRFFANIPYQAVMEKGSSFDSIQFLKFDGEWFTFEVSPSDYVLLNLAGDRL